MAVADWGNDTLRGDSDAAMAHASRRRCYSAKGDVGTGSPLSVCRLYASADLDWRLRKLQSGFEVDWAIVCLPAVLSDLFDIDDK